MLMTQNRQLINVALPYSFLNATDNISYTCIMDRHIEHIQTSRTIAIFENAVISLGPASVKNCWHSLSLSTVLQCEFSFCDRSCKSYQNIFLQTSYLKQSTLSKLALFHSMYIQKHRRKLLASCLLN